MQSDNLKKKTFKGLSWSLLDNLSNQGLTFLVGIILARLLSPEEYGILGIIMIFIALFNGIVDCGLSTALIRKIEPSEKDYNTVFISNLFLSVLMYVVLFLLSRPISVFFDTHLLLPISRVMGVVLIINSLSIIHRTILIKRIDFRTQTKISLISSMVSGLLGIIVAIKGGGVWSLVIQQVTRSLLTTLFLWVWCNWMPRFLFSLNSFRELFGYGWKLMLSNMINTVWNEIYQIVIGKCYSAASLGQYTRAKQFSDIFSSNLTSVIQRVTFPVFSSIQDDTLRLKNNYRKALRVTSLVTCVLLFGLAGISENLILLLLGEDWADAALYLPLICMNGIFFPLSALNLNILMIQGKSGLYLKLEIIKKIIAIAPILIGVFMNIYWMLLASVVYGIIAYLINAHYSGKELSYSIKEQIKDLSLSLVIAIFMYVLILLVDSLHLSYSVKLLIQIVGGGGFVVCILEFLRNEDYVEIKNLVKQKISEKNE